MPFEEGVSGNPNGRPEGAINKSSIRIKEAFQQLLEGSLKTLEKDLKALEPKDRLNFIKDLSEYILPKLARIDSNINANITTEKQVFKIGDTIIEL